LILGGKPTSVTGTVARFLRPIEADDFAAATIAFEGGAIATLQATVDTYPNNLATRLTILGETGTVEISGAAAETVVAWRFPPDDRWRDIDEMLTQGIVPDSNGRKNAHAGVYQDLARAIANGARPIADYASARTSAEIVLAILRSHRDGAPVRFPVDFATTDMVGVDIQPYRETRCSSSI
jgi:UDP-N-acetyl-2-amino-2-deoxyglucuronate dehydrogenase